MLRLLFSQLRSDIKARNPYWFANIVSRIRHGKLAYIQYRSFQLWPVPITKEAAMGWVEGATDAGQYEDGSWWVLVLPNPSAMPSREQPDAPRTPQSPDPEQ